MNKTKKLLSVVLAIVMALSCMSMTASAAKTAYQSVEDLTNLKAYSDYGQVTRLSTEERTSIVFDALDNILVKANINLGTVVNVDLLGLVLKIDLRGIDEVCSSLDTVKSTIEGVIAKLGKAFLNLGILEDLQTGTWQTGMTRDNTAQFTILSEIFELLSNNTTLVERLFTDGLDLGLIGSFLGNLDLSSIESLIMNLPGLVKGLIYPMIERWDDTLTLIKDYDNSIAGTGKNVEAIANMRVKKLFNDNMSITTIKYDANGNMTSEHDTWKTTATGSAAPGTPSNNSPRCYYQFSSTTPGSVMTVYHIVDAKEAETLAKTPDKVNGSPAAYTYFKEAQTFVMSQEVEGSETYVWKATDEWDNTWSLKWYNDDSQFLPGFSGDDFDLATMSLADLLYTFIPDVFSNMAPVVLNGSIKKILADFLGADFTYVGSVAKDSKDIAAVEALADYNVNNEGKENNIFTMPQGDYLWEWSYYEIINGHHYYRFQDQIFVGDTTNKNNYFDIINWDYEIGADFMNEFIPTNPSKDSTLLMNLNNFIVKVADTALKSSASTEDAISGFKAQWTRPNLDELKGDNSMLVNTLKTIAQAVIGLAPQHVFGSDYATNERCYVELMLNSDNDTVLTGIAAHLVNMIMPSMSLPGKSDLLASKAKVGAILAAVVREFAAYLAPEYNFDALIYTDFGTTTADKVKTFVDPQTAGLLSANQTASSYWFDVILTMGINVGFEYLRAFSDMGEGTAQWNSFVAYSGYGVDGKTYAAGTTQATLNAEWEGMLDYIIDWALTTDVEWCWKIGNLVTVANVNLATGEDPFAKLDTVLLNLLPITEVLNITGTNSTSKVEQFLRYDLILGLVDLKWGALLDTLKVPDGFVRNANVLDQLAAKLKGIVNFLFAKVGNSADNFALIPSAITDFDTLANQNNLKEMVKNLVGALYNAFVTDGLAATAFPFLNFILGWKTDPQQIADPQIWTTFRDNNDYAFQWVENGVYPTIDADNTQIHILNNSAGMLETHRNSSVTDHAYDIQINSVTSDATTNKLTFTLSDSTGLISPYETLDIKIGGTYSGEEAATITIAYDYVGKDGSAIGGTQYTSLTIFFSNQYEDSNISGRFAEDDDKDYSGTDDFGRYQFVEDLYETVVNYQAHIFYVGATTSNPDKSLGTIAAPDYDEDCSGNKTYYNMTTPASTYFAFRAADSDAGWLQTLTKDNNNSYGYLYKAKSGVTAAQEESFPYGEYYMGRIAVAYGSDNKQYEISFIHYNDYDVYDIYKENQWNGYHANQGVDATLYNEYNAAWKDIVKYATYPMMTTAAGSDASVDYVSAIMPKIEPAIERFEAAKIAYETALADAQASASSSGAVPSYIATLRDEIDNDFANGKEINFQDYEFYEYFNYNDVKVAAENLYRSFLAPDVMDTYYILNSGIREAELDLVIGKEANSIVAAGITASRLQNDKAAVDASIAAHNDWKMPATTKLHADDFTSRLAYYKQFLAPNAEGNEHLYFLNQEIAHIEAQGLDADDYTADSWANYTEKLATAKAVAAGNDEFAAFNSRIYDVKYNLMVAYKNLLEKDRSLIVKGGTADLIANIDIADAIFASLEAEDGAWTISENYITKYLSDNKLEVTDENREIAINAAYAQLISALGYNYQAIYTKHDIEVQKGTKNEGDLKVNADGSAMMFNLYADSALEYKENDRPNNQGNQAKVNAANDALVAAIKNFEATAKDPNTLVLNENAPFEAVIDLDNNIGGEYTGTVYGFDTTGLCNENWEADGTIADFLSTAYGDDYLEVVVGDAGVETTGTVINVLDENGDVVESYMFVLFGDADMDGLVGESDAAMSATYEIEYIGFDNLYQFMAGDLDYDALPGEADAGIMATWEIEYYGMPYQVDVAAGVYGSIIYEIY